MGIHADKNSIIASALNKISATAGTDFSRDTSVYSDYFRTSLDEIISEAMENFVFPFAVSFLHLTNPTINTLVDSGESPGDVYTIPLTARVVGVYKKDNLPFVIDVVSQANIINSCSLPFSLVNGNTLYTQSKEEDLYCVYIDLSPSVKNMSPKFQQFLVYRLTETVFFRYSTNSQYLSYLRRTAFIKLDAAKKSALLSSSNAVRNYVTLADLTEYGNTDGTV